MADRADWRESAPMPSRPNPSRDPTPTRPDPGREEGVDVAEHMRLLRARRQARQRTLQLTEWLGFAAIVLGVEVLFGVACGLIALGVALVVVANAS